jgi:hypothetical protein
MTCLQQWPMRRTRLRTWLAATGDQPLVAPKEPAIISAPLEAPGGDYDAVTARFRALQAGPLASRPEMAVIQQQIEAGQNNEAMLAMSQLAASVPVAKAPVGAVPPPVAAPVAVAARPAAQAKPKSALLIIGGLLAVGVIGAALLSSKKGEEE